MWCCDVHVVDLFIWDNIKRTNVSEREGRGFTITVGIYINSRVRLTDLDWRCVVCLCSVCISVFISHFSRFSRASVNVVFKKTRKTHETRSTYIVKKEEEEGVKREKNDFKQFNWIYSVKVFGTVRSQRVYACGCSQSQWLAKADFFVCFSFSRRICSTAKIDRVGTNEKQTQALLLLFSTFAATQFYTESIHSWFHCSIGRFTWTD